MAIDMKNPCVRCGAFVDKDACESKIIKTPNGDVPFKVCPFCGASLELVIIK